MKTYTITYIIAIVLSIIYIIPLNAQEGQSNLLTPSISATPNPMLFEDTYVGQFTQQLLTIENTGTSTLDITNVTTTDPAFIEAVTSFSIEPGETQSFIVRFQPIELGFIEGAVQIENNSAISTFEVPLSGTGIEPNPSISVSPDPLVLPDTYIGSDSQNNLFITNTGLATLTITDFVFSNSDFFTYNNPPISLEPGETHDMVIKFAPFELGLREGSVQFISNDPNNPTYEVQLSGMSIDDPINGWEWHYTGFNYILMDMAFPEGQNQIGYCVGQTLTYNGDGVVIKTTDGGDNWEAVTTGVFPGLQGCSFPSLNTGYAVGWDGYIIKTEDGGETWTELFVASGLFELTDVEFKDTNNGVAIGSENAYFTNDGGQTWTPSTGITAVGYQIDYAADDTYYIAANEGHIFKSNDGGQNWVDVGLGGGLLLGLNFLNADYGIVTGDNGIIAKTIDGGDNWELQQVNDNLFHGVFIWDQDTSWIVGTPDLIYKSIDGGVSYTSQYPPYSAWKALYRVHFTDNYTGFICGGSNGIVLRKQGLDLVPNITVTPSSINFEDTYIGETSQSTITISNTGLASLEVNNIQSSNTNFDVDITSFVLEPGNSQEVEISFTPNNIGIIEGIIQIESNDPETDIYEIAVAGTGVEALPAISVNPVELLFDTTLVSQSSVKTLQISNTGVALLSITNISSNNEVFSTSINSITVEAGSTQEVEVTFTPTQEMMFNGTLQIESNDPEMSLLDIPLSGYGKLITGLQISMENKINVYPNPAKATLYIENATNCIVYIYSLKGKLVKEYTISSNSAALNVQDLVPGTYILKTSKGNEMITRKFEITR